MRINQDTTHEGPPIRNPWYWGQQAEIARLIGKTPTYVSDVLRGRRAIRPRLARDIARITERMDGATVTLEDLLFPDESENPAILFLRNRKARKRPKKGVADVDGIEEVGDDGQPGIC